MSNKALAEIATNGVANADWAPTADSWCQKFARLCIEHEYGNKYDAFMQKSANLTGRAFQAGGLALTKDQAGELQEGDLLYKCPPDLDAYGHVGIYVGNNHVAENSSTSIGRVRGALGYRTIAEFGEFQLVVRLPPPNTSPSKKPGLIIGVSDGKDVKYTRLQNAELKGGVFTADVAELAKVLLNGSQPIRTAVAAMGFTITDEGNYLNDVADPRQYVIVQKNAA